MRLRHLSILLTVGCVPIAVFATSDTVMQALFGAQEKKQEVSIPGERTSKTMTKSQSMAKAPTCEQKYQKSLPIRFVHSLLLEEGAKLTPSHNPDTGELKIYGGRMIGNCNNMLDYILSPPGEDHPYVFQVKLKGCGQEKCTYKVKTVENGKTVDIEKEFESNMDGFVQCLKETGVLVSKDGSEGYSVDKTKIVRDNFQASIDGVTQSSELIFASDGPETDPAGGFFDKSGHRKPGHGCFYFENIKKGGFSIYSFDEVEFNRKNNEARNLCAEKNYKTIDKRLSEFAGFDELQAILIESRNKLLEGEVQAIADEIRNSKTLENIETEALNELVQDFDSYIIQPLKQQIMNQYKIYLKAPKGKKAEEQKILSELVKQFVKYTKKPYFNKADHEKMQSFAAKAPIDDEDWAEAVLKINKIQNTIALYSKYGDPKGEKDSPLVADERINEAQGKFARQYAVLRDLDGDPKYSKVKDLRQRSANLRRKIQTDRQVLQRDVYEEQMEAYKRCNNYWVNTQRCFAEVNEDIQSWHRQSQYSNMQRERLAQQFEREAQSWSKVESERNKVYSGHNGGAENEGGPYNFSYQNNLSRTANGPMGPNPYQMQQNFGYPSIGHQPPMNPNFGMNPNFYPGNYNMGYQQNQFAFMDPMMMQQRGPAGYGNQWQFGGGGGAPWNMGPQYGPAQGSMPPPYGNFMGGGQGAYNFQI